MERPEEEEEAGPLAEEEAGPLAEEEAGPSAPESLPPPTLSPVSVAASPPPLEQDRNGIVEEDVRQIKKRLLRLERQVALLRSRV
ncbi:hypothetical protein GDO86_007213 [Hymenochirus boettgeri]|uniref:Uncharacterized protein n=1 Tax=Hymenochirus boettgeri TaxID=247094 RepID=A0A8T2IWV6_9PIPI|nr:hypothetical protein GDO86_007213 [Hymenochirus boettgeri]